MASESRDHQHTFKEEDVPGLAEALAEVAHKWEELAVALRLSEAVRAECREGYSLAMKLYRVLYQWVVGQHSNASPATRENLKRALASSLVQHPQLARELEDKLKTSLSLNTLTTSQKKSIFESGVREVLVKRYSQCPEVPRGSWPPVVNKTFINLVLIETSGRPLKSDYSIQGDADDVLAKQKKVHYEEIFGAYEMKKNLLILGRPGSGKTTLVHKLVRDWSAGKALQGAELVFLISMRMLNSCGVRNLSDMLNKFYFDKKYLRRVCDAIHCAEGRGVCFIFDGFDEYSSPGTIQPIVSELLNKSYLVNSMIVVTSRPAAASAVYMYIFGFFKKVEVFGFTKSQVMEYVNHFPFSYSSSVNKAHSQKLQSYLSSYPGVLDLCYLPVNCAIICFIYDTEPDHLPDTQTQIYALFTRLIIIRQLTSRDVSRQLDSFEDLKGQEAEDFKKLCSLAFDMTTQSQQVITRGSASSDEAHSLGLVTTDITAGLSGYKNSYSFLHLTLQEFLAAYHLSKLNQKEQISIIEKYSKTFCMGIVWKFYFGLVNFETGIDRARKIFSNVFRQNLFGIQSGLLFKIQCSYEAKQACIIQLMSSEFLEFSGALSNYDMSAIAYTMSVAAIEESLATPTRHLKISFRSSVDNKLKTLINGLNARALEYIERLEIDSSNIRIVDIKVLAEILKLNKKSRTGTLGLKNVKYLNLQCNGIIDEGVAVLAAGLDGNHVLESLDLSWNCISATGVRQLMSIDCRLECLNLSSNKIGNEGAIAVARGLRGNHTLKSINLSDNKIGVAGVEALALVLQENSLNVDLSNSFSFIRPSLDLITSDSNSSKSETGDVTEPRVMIREPSDHFKLQKLDLSRNIWDRNPVTIISQFKSLSHLDLSGNDFSFPEVLAIVDYVANSDNCQQLEYLGLAQQYIHRVPYQMAFYHEFVRQEHLGQSSATVSNITTLMYESKDLIPSSGFIIDLSGNNMSKTRTMFLLSRIKKYDRVGAVYLKDNGIPSNEVLPDEDTIANLKKTFQHDRIDRLLIFGLHNLSFKVPASNITSEPDSTNRV